MITVDHKDRQIAECDKCGRVRLDIHGSVRKVFVGRLILEGWRFMFNEFPSTDCKWLCPKCEGNPFHAEHPAIIPPAPHADAK